ncbi:VOC family protein [Azospirillum doebereinerae]|uniref:VOC family protein n=1 Tax=Azospirillum doebereinerae TaxID=92933 RepID=A0A3S0V481_9PROT|nr:VOC family protein [Azospirillum doebereinerae]MCG5242448.1 VOC family protein [Azospirillum doebereinerae]RUQ66094.1 VOC family protein [Azospirillum doebereinerae]
MEPRISLVTLGVADLARSRRFYEQGLGWTPSPAGNDNVAFYQLGGMALGLFSRAALAEDAHLPDAGDPTRFGGITLAQNVRSKAEVDAVLALAERAGARILKPGQDVFWGGYSGYFADPDGHPWEIAWNPFFTLDAAGNMTLSAA